MTQVLLNSIIVDGPNLIYWSWSSLGAFSRFINSYTKILCTVFPEYNTLRAPFQETLYLWFFINRCPKRTWWNKKGLSVYILNLYSTGVVLSKRGYKGTDQQHSCCVRRLCFLIRNRGFLMFPLICFCNMALENQTKQYWIVTRILSMCLVV